MRRLFFTIILFAVAFNCISQNNKASDKKIESLYNEAKANAQAGDKVKAIALLKQVLKNDPQYYMAFFGLADIYHETKERQLEKDALVNGLRISLDRFPGGYKFLAELLYAEAAYDEAL